MGVVIEEKVDEEVLGEVSQQKFAAEDDGSIYEQEPPKYNSGLGFKDYCP